MDVKKRRKKRKRMVKELERLGEEKMEIGARRSSSSEKSVTEEVWRKKEGSVF